MRNRKEVYRQRHRINPRNTYAKIPKKPKEIPEVSDYEEEYENPNDSQPTLSKFLEGIGMGRKPEDNHREMLNRLMQETQLAREMEQRVVLGLVTKVVDVLENGTEDDEEELLEELKDFLDAVNGTYRTKN